ncbi:MAG: SUMF1/EgtB/PvdO family nonheme iron enzyme [Bradymonadales bacterium]|nr:SUMF1/EgtB/PvdO family nonheme iron enzyme [Bradymonadales bacterium]
MVRASFPLILLALMAILGCPESNAPSMLAPTAGPPDAVTLYPAYGITHDALILIWSACEEQDFKSYSVLRSLQPEVDRENATWLAEYLQAALLSYEDTGLDPETTYYYRILVTDTEGLSSLSNEVSATTLGETPPQPPVPVVLFPPEQVTDQSAWLVWSNSLDEDFAGYALLRGGAPGVTAETGTIRVEYTDSAQVSFLDTGLSADTDYYYRVLVRDNGELSSLSNEVLAHTATAPVNVPPLPVSLYPPYNATSSALSLTWSVNHDEDFAGNTLLHSTEPIADATEGTVLLSTSDRLEVSFEHTDLTPSSIHYYRLVTADEEGETALSNQVSGRTLPETLPSGPTPVTLGPVYNVTHDSLTLSWTQNQDDNFLRYELVRSLSSPVTSSDLLIHETTDRAETSFTDDDLEVYQRYFYRVWVFNQEGTSIPSNEVSGTTTYDTAPAPVMLADPTEITGTGMTLAWERSSAADFAHYRLYRATGPVVDQTATAVWETSDQDALQFSDSGLQPDTVYYYRLYVVDSWGIGTGSNIVQGTTLNTEAPRCHISRSYTWLPVEAWFLFTAVECEDNLTPVADLQVRWNFGDGEGWTDYTTSKLVSYSYANRGAYWVTLEVFDGTYSSQSMAVVVVGQMVPIEAGHFNMGRESGSTPWPEMEPLRLVQMDGFFIDTFEVTNAEYAAFLSDGNPGHHWVSQDILDNYDGTFTPVAGLENRPAASVSWYDAAAYCAWVEKSLPTEAQWEYAARGPTGGPNSWYPWGDTHPSAVTPTPVNFANLVGHTVDVESYPNGVTAWNPAKVIWQMAGNVDEWVFDLYDPDYYQWANDNSGNINPTGPTTSPYAPALPAYRVTRGGGMANDENPLRVSFRCYGDPYSRSTARGFRCVAQSLP